MCSSTVVTPEIVAHVNVQVSVKESLQRSTRRCSQVLGMLDFEIPMQTESL